MTNKFHVWVIDDDTSIRWVLEKALTKANFDVTLFKRGKGVLTALKETVPNAILSDIRMPDIDGISLMQDIKSIHADLPVIIMTAHSDLDSAVSAFQSGAFEYLPKPFDLNEVVAKLTHACKLNINTKPVVEEPIVTETAMIGAAPAMQEVFRAIGRLSRSTVSVLITGESGSGKELVAEALHNHSLRHKAPFVALNMAAIPKDLLESELFGHEKGAFTGAQSQRKGRFEQAKGGTLFLDEIGDMPAEAQTRLLRVLSNNEFYRVGGTNAIKAHVRIIAATHQNLEKMVANGDFREDLFYRLNVIHIEVPSLRQRKADIPLLLNHFLQSAAGEIEVEAKTLSTDALNKLMAFHWPGNVRQLFNTARWLTVMAAGKEIQVEDLPAEFNQLNADINQEIMAEMSWQQSIEQWIDQQLNTGQDKLLTIITPQIEKLFIEKVLEHTNGRKQEAAKILGWGRNTLTRKIKELI